jgi:hypothetical protein
MHSCSLYLFPYPHHGELYHGPKALVPEEHGVLYDIFKVLSKEMNFRMIFIFNRDYNDDRFKPFQIVVLNGCLPPSFSEAAIRPKRHLSQPYFSAMELMAVPLGEEYSGYEKLLFPFDKFTWFLVIFTFVATYLVIFIISFANVKIRNLICGENVENPSLNVAAHFFGLGNRLCRDEASLDFLS